MGEDTTRTRRMPPAGRDGGRRAPSFIPPLARSGPEEDAAMAPLALRLIRPSGESYTSRPRRSPTWSSGPVEKASAEVLPPGSEVV
jgi:hypothetical protein